ncbi:hypothetical protein IKD57_03350 [Candidatus Saccharibacteria bacterium]|nr:hypothetical protein [Candidatus Saccharibacteria bacterium]
MEIRDCINMTPENYAWRFSDDEDSRFFANRLLEYIVFDTKPKITPAIWQDVEIFIRFKKRDVWSLKDWQIQNARRGIMLYRIKYVVEYLTKTEIIEIFNRFYQNTEYNLFDLFGKKFHAPIDSLFLVQEKHIVSEDELGNFDQIFEYPGWVEFSDAANKAIFDKIYKNQLTDEQIDYFLGASDDINGYDEWFKIAKHILTTTKNAHTFWTAGDVLSIIRRAVPNDEESQKWFKDQIFEIFWPRVKSVWPMLNQAKVDFKYDDDAKILKDSIGWLETLDDLKERLPELGKNYELGNYKTPGEEFAYEERFLVGRIDSGNASLPELIDELFNLTEIVCSELSIEHLEQMANENLVPLIKESENEVDIEQTISLVHKAIQHGKNTFEKLKKEGENLSKNLIQNRGQK